MGFQGMTDLVGVWDSSEILPWDLPATDDTVEFLQDFKARTKSEHIVKLRWQCNGLPVECQFPAVPLPDRSGVVIKDNDFTPTGSRSFLRVINADGSLRVRIAVPLVDLNSKPDIGFLELPRIYLGAGVNFGVPGNDGHVDWIFDFDWKTGKLLRAEAAPQMRH